MPAPEWYTGSDHTGRVAAGIEVAINHMDDHTAGEQDISALRDLLDIEEEPNWRSFLHGLLGTIHYDLKHNKEARSTLLHSVAGYRVYFDSFDEVLSVYCQSCYTLGTMYFDDELFTEATSYFMRCLPYMKEVFDEPFIANIYTYLNISLSMIDEDVGSLIFCEAAAFARHCDCEGLENLMTAYVSSGDITRATEIFSIMSERCQDYERFDSVLEFAQEMLGESGPVN